MTASTFNPLEAVRTLKAAGIEAEHAEAIADQLRAAATADHDELATKGDLALLKGDLAELRTELKGEIAGLRVELKGEIAAVRNELKGEIGAVRVEGRIIGAIVLAMAAKMFGIFNAVAGVLS